jgi:peptidoglycan/xylan/chitin deacetylase (PgdA/CDA1 family)
MPTLRAGRAHRRRFVAAAVLASELLAPPAMAQESYPWPGGRRAAVSLAYDDALPSQLDVAIPALDRRGLRASFYLTLANDTLRTRMSDWRAAAARGHELGNHTLFHQCSSAAPGHEWVEPHRDLDSTSAAQMRDQVRIANTLLFALDGRDERTFTPPCGESRAHGEDYVTTVADDFLAIRRGDGAIVADMRALDLKAVPVAAPAGLTGAQLIAIVEEAARRGTLASLTFHGVGGDYLATSREAHEQLLDHLAAHPERYWVDTFANITRFIREQRARGDRNASTSTLVPPSLPHPGTAP